MILPKKILELLMRKIACFSFYRGYKKIRLKIIAMEERIRFLVKCKKFDIVPKFLSFKVPTNGAFNNDHVHKFQIKLLKSEIQKTR